MKYGNKLTKNEILEKAAKEGFFLNTDGIQYDLDGRSIAAYVKSIGFKVAKYYDTGSNGLVLTEEGLSISTNGYCSLISN